MRTWLAWAVILFGAVIVGAGGVALYQHAIIADETGTSGWNPALWIVILAGGGVSVMGIVLLVDARSKLSHVARSGQPQGRRAED